MLYEYRIERLRTLEIASPFGNHAGEVKDIERTVADLNKWARDDWELVSVVPAGAEWLAFLKRPAGE